VTVDLFRGETRSGVEATPRFLNNLEPVPDHVSARPL
jgi:hypothetical protein